MRMTLLVLAVMLVATGCASAPHPRTFSYSPSGTPALAGPEQRLPRRQGAGDDATTREAVLEGIADVKASLGGVEAALSKLTDRPSPLVGWSLKGVFTRYLDHGSSQVKWMKGALESATALTRVASEVEDSDMEQGLLRMTGPKLQAALFGTLLMATWVDFLHLADAVLRNCPTCSVEELFVDLHRVQELMEPALADLASQDSERVDAVAMPELMGRLTREFDAIHRDARASMKLGGQVIAAVRAVEMLAMISTLKVSLPRLPPSAPTTVGVGFVMSSGGVMTGSRLVVSAEWVEMMRRLVRAGVISVPAVSSAVLIHGGQVLMAQAPRDLPKGVREALGDSPEVRAMHQTGRAGAGMSNAPKHHVLPQEHREWFERRGFKGDMDIDQFCVRMERANHEAIHGGGDWRLGRTWPGEWNRMIMGELRRVEARIGRALTRNEVLDIVAARMQVYEIPVRFTKGSSR
ncbi:DUF2380 domain-containing protein [Corallococcus sp. AB038B]|uniref:DUF2380 domain-containing protein n=1 Tax=Corallococcus sp. AB038B TaxID=2316718 RepID=UPI000EC4FC2C|nr:DUF2380 domain-containing protein [Corallococcus sp. AB038B]RKI03497.1 DUF2380 domain-containing protein [Corallococcus sp. AB038B]